MSQDPNHGVYSVDNLLYSEKVVIHQGENAHNVINVINRQQEDSKGTGLEIIEKHSKTKKDGREQKGDGDFESKNFSFDAAKEVTSAMEEMAQIQLCDQSQLRTLIFVLDKQAKSKDTAGFLQTREKIDIFFHTLSTIEGPFRLAMEYMEQGRPFQAAIICKHLITWFKSNIENEGGGLICIQRMTEEYMSLAQDAVLQLLRSESPENEVYKPYLLPLMYEMFNDIEEVKCTEKGYKAYCEVMAGYYVACVHLTLGEWRETYEVCNNMTVKMEEKCEKPEKEIVYTSILSMAGLAKYNMDELEDAQKLWKKTIRVFEQGGEACNSPQKELIESWLNIIKQSLSGVPRKVELVITSKPS